MSYIKVTTGSTYLKAVMKEWDLSIHVDHTGFAYLVLNRDRILWAISPVTSDTEDGKERPESLFKNLENLTFDTKSCFCVLAGNQAPRVRLPDSCEEWNEQLEDNATFRGGLGEGLEAACTAKVTLHRVPPLYKAIGWYEPHSLYDELKKLEKPKRGSHVRETNTTHY